MGGMRWGLVVPLLLFVPVPPPVTQADRNVVGEQVWVDLVGEPSDAGLNHLAGLIRRDLNSDIETLPGSGAAGGLGGGLVAFAGATIASGIDTVLDAVEFERRVHGCNLCLTGEGQIDAQSLSGKACMGVARRASKHEVPTIALVGAVGPGAEHCLQAGLRDFILIGEGLPADVSMRQAGVLIADAAGQVARNYLTSI